MKTLIRTLALASFILLGCNGLRGQKSLLLQDIQPLMTYSSESSSNIILSADNSSNSYQFYLEEKIQVNDWMVNREEWLKEGNSGLVSSTRLETEKELVVEDWMISNFNIGDNWLSNLVREEKEPPLKLQDWMVCCEEWQAVRL